MSLDSEYLDGIPTRYDIIACNGLFYEYPEAVHFLYCDVFLISMSNVSCQEIKY